MPPIKQTEISDNSLMFIHQTRIRSQLIYTVTLLAVVGALFTLPFLYTTISVTGSGILRSTIEKSELLSPISGQITFVSLKDNQKVGVGDTLITIDATSPKQRDVIVNQDISRIRKLLTDVLNLLSYVDSQSNEQPVLHTGLYLANWQHFEEQIQIAVNSKNQALNIFKRYDVLYQKKVVTQTEFEQYKFNYEQASSELNLIYRKYKSQWQTESNQYRSELSNMQSQKNQLVEQEKLYTMKAVINGSVQNLVGVQVGSYISVNQKIGEISPDSTLLAFCYIKPSDIGLLKKGQEVRLQIDAFNYNQWGMLYGFVDEISEDVILINDAPFFKVKCKLDKAFLQLKNGYKGQIKKGMTFSAHFSVAKRSFYELLYDNIDDWINPNNYITS